MLERPTVSARRPVKGGAAMLAIAIIRPTCAIDSPRRPGEVLSLAAASEEGVMAAAKNPWRNRRETRRSADVARRWRRVVTARARSERPATRKRPRRSDIEPKRMLPARLAAL